MRDSKVLKIAVQILILLLLIIWKTFSSYSQIEDCVGAYPVCGNGDISFVPQGTGADDFALPGNEAPACGFKESKNIWLRIKIKTAGSLGFDLVPDDQVGNGRDDYDFAVYGPDVSCSNLGSSIRCSSTNPQAANVGANTGMNQSESEYNEGPGPDGNGYVHWLDQVHPGEVYYILIDNFYQDKGFELNWTGTALLEDRITKEEGGVDLGEDINLCDNESTILDATTLGGVDYLWNTGEQTATIEVEDEGEYHVAVTTEAGCVSRDTIAVQLIQAPIIQSITVTPTKECEPLNSVTFSSSGTFGNYEWFNPSGTSVGTGKVIQLNNLNAEDSGEYVLRVTRDNGCEDTETINLEVYPLPDITFTGYKPYCEHDDVQITASGASTYRWYDPSGTEISTSTSISFSDIRVNQAGMYSVIGTSEFGCETIKDFEIEVFPEIIVDITEERVSACSNDIFSVLATSNQANVSYEWKNPSGTNIGNSASLELEELGVSETGYYTVTGTNAAGCSAVDSVYIDIAQSYQFDNSVERCPGDSFQIPQTGEIVSASDTIFVNLLTDDGCDSIYVYAVNFLPCADKQCIGVPNAFAPDGSGLNEAFHAIFSQDCNPEYFDLKLFNRWGEVVFHSNNVNEGWTGIHNGAKAISGFYLWTMEYKFADQESNLEQLSGGVHLLR